MQVKVTKKYIRRREKGVLKTYRAGQVLDVSEDVYKALKDRLALVDEKPPVEKQGTEGNGDDERLALLDKAKELGLNPHPNTGIEKLKRAIAEAEKTEDNGDQ